jgi:hypothetical protein
MEYLNILFSQMKSHNILDQRANQINETQYVIFNKIIDKVEKHISEYSNSQSR